MDFLGVNSLGTESLPDLTDVSGPLSLAKALTFLPTVDPALADDVSPAESGLRLGEYDDPMLEDDDNVE